MNSTASQVSAFGRRALVGVTTLALAGFFLSTAHAQKVADIRKAGVLRAGVQVAQVPWGFTDSSNKLTGFDVEFVEMLAKDLGVRAEFTPVTPANRTAALLTGQVDILAAVIGIFADRQKVVLFSRPYSANDNVVIAKAGAQWKSFDDLKNMRIGVARSAPGDLILSKARIPGATVQRFDDDANTVQALIAGQVDAVGTAMTQVANINKVAGPGKYETRLVLNRAYNGAAVRPGEREWVNYVNEFIGRKLASGELPALYKKWIGTELPKLPDSGEGEGALPVAVTN